MIRQRNNSFTAGFPIINRIRSEERPLRWIISRLLWKTRLCSALSVRLPQGPKVGFYPSSISAELWVNPQAHSEELAFIARRINSGDTFVDIGANIGQFTLVGAQRVGAQGTVIAIEPHPRTFSFLRKNVESNGFSNVRLINAAVGSANGHAYICDACSDDMNHIGSSSGIKVPMITLDSLEIPGTVGLLKIDVEGFELEVLQGAVLLLKRVQCIFFECSEWNLIRYGHNGSELRVMLESADFEIYRQQSGALVRVERNYDASAGGNLVALRKT